MTLVDVDLEIEKSEAAAEDEPVLAAADLPSIHTDPFANREGKTLTWKNINMTLVSKSILGLNIFVCIKQIMKTIFISSYIVVVVIY